MHWGLLSWALSLPCIYSFPFCLHPQTGSRNTRAVIMARRSRREAVPWARTVHLNLPATDQLPLVDLRTVPSMSPKIPDQGQCHCSLWTLWSISRHKIPGLRGQVANASRRHQDSSLHNAQEQWNPESRYSVRQGGHLPNNAVQH